MKILVGTLLSGENEFAQCRQSITEQTFQNIEHRVIEGLSAADAHQTLFRDFMDRANEFRFMLKIDADMVLARPTFISELAGLFSNRTDIHHCQIGVHDWFTNRMIFGMNAYRNTIRWRFDDSIFVEDPSMLKLLVDDKELDFPKSASIHDKTVLAPAAFHSPDPSPFQAFHFGLHKGVKVIEALDRAWHMRIQYHSDYIQQTYENYLRCRDIRLLLAAAGGETAVARRLPTTFASYKDQGALNLFEEFQSLEEPELLEYVRSCRKSRSAARLSMQDYFQIQQNGLLTHWRRRLIPSSVRKFILDLGPGNLQH